LPRDFLTATAPPQIGLSSFIVSFSAFFSGLPFNDFLCFESLALFKVFGASRLAFSFEAVFLPLVPFCSRFF